MTGSGSRHISPWVETSAWDPGPSGSLPTDTVDVVVVGGGIVGVTTALLLQQAGLRVVVVEARRVMDSVTTHSTVKVTYAHGTICSAIEDAHGTAAASVYAEANVAGLGEILRLADSLQIDCMLERDLPHVLYAETGDDLPALEREARTWNRLGVQVGLGGEVPLPFPVAGVLRFPGQAQFHPARYLAGLADAFRAADGVLVERARALQLDEDADGCTVSTTLGTVTARHVVIATQYPVLDRGGHFARLTARRSYGVAGVLPAGTPAGMTINVGSPTHSTRTAHLHGEDLLVVVGEGHPVGHTSATQESWQRLRHWATERFGVTEYRYHWSAQEISSEDRLPYIGWLRPGRTRVATAAAFDGWGMTNGTAAAMVIRDLLLGRDNPWADTFDARRAMTTLPAAETVTHNLHVARTWLKDRVAGSPEGSPDDVSPGQAAVLEVDGEQTAVYRDDAGTVHAVSAVCTHMGCTVAWNDGETSWDCPCHGSRFAVDGSVLHGPATEPLQRRPR